MTALASIEVCGRRFSIRSVCLRQWVIFIWWTISGVAIVRVVTSVQINRECGLFTCVLRTTFLPIIKRTGCYEEHVCGLSCK